MQKLLYVLLALFIVNPAFAAMFSLYVGTGTAENAVGAGDIYATGDAEVDGVLLLEAVAAAIDDVTPTVAGGNILVTGVNTVPTAITDLDDPIPGATYTIICGDVANASTIADAGNFTLNGAWNPTTISDSITLYCFADNDYREVSRSYAATGPGIFTTVDGTDATFTGDVAGGEDLSFGQDPPDLFLGYKDRSDFITWQDDFTGGVQATYDAKWTTAGVVGAGTNTPTVRPGWSELVTGGAGGPDMESTVSILAEYVALGEPRLEAVVDIAAIAATTQRFEIGLFIAANEQVEIIYDTAQGPNWMLEVDDTTGVERIDSGIAVVAATPTKLEIQVDAAGAITWAINDVAMTVVGLANVMTANPYSIQWMLTDIAAVAHTAAVDYVQIEQLRQQ